MKFFATALFAFLLMPATSMSLEIGELYVPLIPMSEKAAENLKNIGAQVCGPYFAQMEPESVDSPRILFIAGWNKDWIRGIWGRDRFVVITRSDATTPRVQKIQSMPDEKVSFHLVITMSEQDAALARPCMPTPSASPPVPRSMLRKTI